ncbi:MAG: DUF1566 domain-containing protein [Proteobacteria bacterium]|nr:DUF1566 domain-containing protein [Pseudomonadota bacterium]
MKKKHNSCRNIQSQTQTDTPFPLTVPATKAGMGKIRLKSRLACMFLLMCLFFLFTMLALQACWNTQPSEDDEDAGSDTGVDNTDADIDGDSDSDGDTDTDIDADTDSDLDSDTDSDSDIDTDTDMDTDTDTDSDPACDGEGIWHDTTSKLCWQDPPSRSQYGRQEAINYCNILSLRGYDDWRLPSIDELRSLIRGCLNTEPGGSCQVTDESIWLDITENCWGCRYGDGPGINGCFWSEELTDDLCGAGGINQWFWSSSNSDTEWYILFTEAQISYENETLKANARCVRGGR